MIFVSLAFHAGILSLLFFTPSFTSPKLTFGPVYTVSLVNFSGKALERGSISTARELMAKGRTETILKKRLESEQTIPIRTLESRRKQNHNLERAMAEIRKRATATESNRKPQPKAAAAKNAASDGKAGSASAPSGSNADANTKVNAYYALIWSRIKSQWALPQGMLPGDLHETVIDVTILRSGAVTEVTFEKKSGNRYFDESALKAIRKASPFPPLPSWIGGSSLDVGIRFRPSELRP